MILYYNNVRSNAKNALYPMSTEINSTEDLEKVVSFDHVCAEYKDNYRKNDNFIFSNCSMFDVDNADSDNSEDWISPADVQKAFPNVPFYVSYSRNHMKPKNNKAPRPKFHIYFPDIDFTDKEEYKNHKNKVCYYFLAFDRNAKDTARFFFGVEKPQVEYYDGYILLSDFMKTVRINENQKINNTDIISEGQRNSTLHTYALKTLTRYGNANCSYNKYIEESKKCSPLLDEKEVKSIWNSAVKYFDEVISKEKDYIPPEQYNMQTQLQEFALPIVDVNAVISLLKPDAKQRKLTVATTKLILKAFDVSIKLNDMNRQTEIYGLPDKYNKDDISNILATLISDIAYQMSYKRATISTVQCFLNAIANENHYHPITKLLDSKEWDNIDRLPEIYDMLGLTDGFHKTLVRKWALQTVAILYNTQEKPISAQGVLVLQGNQGIGKTEFFRHIAIKEQYFKGGAILDMANKDSLMSATKVWICELGEIDSTTKKEQSALKAFLTETTDRYREPYARFETIKSRRTSFCGTVNPKEYLRDETGNRRFWTIPVEKIDINKIFSCSPEWYIQFWKQMQEEYKLNPKGYLLTSEEQDKVNCNNSDFEADMYGEDEFITNFDFEADESQWEFKTAAQIANSLNNSYKSLHISSSQVGKLLNHLEGKIGREFKRKKVRGKKLILCPPYCGNY